LEFILDRLSEDADLRDRVYDQLQRKDSRGGGSRGKRGAG